MLAFFLKAGHGMFYTGESSGLLGFKDQTGGVALEEVPVVKQRSLQHDRSISCHTWSSDITIREEWRNYQDFASLCFMGL